MLSDQTLADVGSWEYLLLNKTPSDRVMAVVEVLHNHNNRFLIL
jgi:hypothetical protein